MDDQATRTIVTPVRERSRGFSLLELAAVITVTGLLATVVVLNLLPRLATGARGDAVAQLAEIDALARRVARQHRSSVTVQFRIGTSRIERSIPDSTQRLAWQLPRPWRVTQLRQLETSQEGAGPAEALRFSRDGMSCSYAVELRAEDQPPAWVLVMGLSGEVREIDEATLEQLLASLEAPEAPAGPDAD